MGKSRQCVNLYYKDGRLIESDIKGKFLAKELIENVKKIGHLNNRARDWAISGQKSAIEGKIEGATYIDRISLHWPYTILIKQKST